MSECRALLFWILIQTLWPGKNHSERDGGGGQHFIACGSRWWSADLEDGRQWWSVRRRWRERRRLSGGGAPCLQSQVAGEPPVGRAGGRARLEWLKRAWKRAVSGGGQTASGEVAADRGRWWRAVVPEKERTKEEREWKGGGGTSQDVSDICRGTCRSIVRRRWSDKGVSEEVRWFFFIFFTIGGDLPLA